ncbi:hypothetical protein RhiirA5_467157 [Rhizophagus irregularis]|uniref:MATA-HMG n=3 Tax=Rhizophagus irregularis TaxID=588596 RepID=A0A1B1EVL3_9GLOM|nr:MATA-HMG [Rhizophagus irregularis]EXX55945.1 hypothetical protein RirG_220590 [Rhizophagus irregularis DAOM 197198w]ANQ32865.1 MATA-HMG [Rhizophagus irregularis]PKC11551.1 hypothetical protein RhiirA5_467157 [Rhizophagus irregularis]PKY17447.1 hypothetical protein RhiirB3_487500 [Rhizophagus irregularis]
MFTFSSNGNDSEPNSMNTMTIIDETETITTQKNKQVFSPKQSFPPKPYVEVPLPNHLNIEEYMPKKSGGKKTSNAFIIYRTVFAKVLMNLDYQNKMTDVSKWAAESWKSEKAELITAYKNFANEIQSTHRKRSQDAMINRNRRLIAATTPRENPAPISVPVNPPRHEIQEIQQFQPNLITEHPINFPYDFPFPQVFNPGSSDKGFQANNSLISIPDYNEFSQSPMSSLFSYGDTLLNEDLEALYLMDSILQQQPQEFHPEFQYGNNDPTWVYPTRP